LHGKRWEMIKVLASGSSGNAIILNGKVPLLIECGLSLHKLLELSNYNLPQFCLVSHEHKDHSLALPDLLDKGVTCYTSRGTAEALGIEHPNLIIISPQKLIGISDWTIKPFPLVHDAKEPLGFLIANKQDKILYACDTAAINYQFEGLTYILIGVNYSMDVLKKNIAEGKVNPEVAKRVIKSHLSLETALDFLKRTDLSRLKAIYLLHLSKDNIDSQEAKQKLMEATGRLVCLSV